jgi:hypothetical protein
VIPIQYGIIGNVSVTPVSTTGVDASLLTYVCLLFAFGIAAVPAFMRLAHIASNERKTEPDL